MLTRKRIIKMIDQRFRKQILCSISQSKKDAADIARYARYVVDGCIIHRDQEHENDKEWGYGFTPVNVLCAVSKSGEILKRIFEFNQVNHFLRAKDGDSAVEVVECILIEWMHDDKSISGFFLDAIDAELKRVEAEYNAAEQKTEQSEPETEQEISG